MTGVVVLLVCLTALAAFRGSRKLNPPYRGLTLTVGIVASVFAVLLGLVTAYGAIMCSSKVMKQGALHERGLIWSIERSGCGATTADVYTVHLGRYAWWRYTIMTSYAFPIPQTVEAAAGDTVRVMIDRDSAGADVPVEGIVVPVFASGKPAKEMVFYKGVLE